MKGVLLLLIAASALNAVLTSVTTPVVGSRKPKASSVIAGTLTEIVSCPATIPMPTL